MSFNTFSSEYKLSDLVEIIGGGTPKTSNNKYWNGDIPWLSVKDFNNDFKNVYETEKKITKLGLENSSTKLLNVGDIIISARGTVGKIAMLGKKMAFNQSCYGLKTKDNIDNDFLYYILKKYIEQIQKNTHGSVFDTITIRTFDSIKVQFPELLSEQKVIANILSTLDEKIELNNQMNKTLEEMAQAIYKSWFVDFEPFQDGEFVESDLGMIPEGWEVGYLKEILKFKNGKRPEEKEKLQKGIYKIPVVGAGGVMGYTKEELYNEAIIIIGRVGTLGVVQRYNSHCWASDNTIVIRTDYYEYIYQILNQINFKSLNRGSTQPLIAQKDLKKIKVIIPPEEILEKFEKQIKNLFKKFKLNKKENKTLENTRDTLLPKLMSGEIRVPLDEEESS